ncbi:MAG: NAD(P)-binding domain-containing protein, partial [Promethearchaeota archaeon]
MVEIFHEADGNINLLKAKIISIIGYGNQGRAQALNLRDSGLKVVVGNINDNYKKIAEEDDFPVYPIKEAVSKSDIVFLLIPDEVMKTIFEEEIRDYLKPNSSIVFASGYNIGFKLISPPDNIDVLLLAPRMIGVGVRENFLNGNGFFSFIGVDQNYTGNAQEILLALAKGIGALKKEAIMLSFKQEAELDLFNEQAFGPAFGRVLLSA